MVTRRSPFPYYILTDDHRVVKAKSLEQWARWYEGGHEKRIVEQTTTKRHWVSTVFIGIDHRFLGKGPPVVFETMTFDRQHVMKMIFNQPRMIREEADIDDAFGRWCSWDDALAGHRSIVRRVKQFEEAKVR